MKKKGITERIETVLQIGKFVFHWGFVPTILYLGFTRGADKGTPPLSVANLIW